MGVTEKLALELITANGAAFHRHERTVGARARRVQRQRKALLWQAHHLAEIPVLLFACMPIPPNSDFNQTRRHSSTNGSIWPAIQNMLLACRAKGLGATATTLHLVYEEEVNALLGLPEDVRSFAMLPIGWPMGKFGPVRRRPVDEVMSWNGWA